MIARASACLVALWTLAAGSVAHADAAPVPGRPEWSDTPVPMPAEPPDVAAIAVSVIVVVVMVASWAIARRAWRARIRA